MSVVPIMIELESKDYQKLFKIADDLGMNPEVYVETLVELTLLEGEILSKVQEKKNGGN